MAEPDNDPVNHPQHYTAHPSGVECIQVVEHMGFCIGNAIKYLWRADLKGDAIEDLRKAAWYVQREIERRARAGQGESAMDEIIRCPTRVRDLGWCVLYAGHESDHRFYRGKQA